MRITTVLFDLDGTLLPMNQDEFTKGYFKLLAAKLALHGYEPKQLIDTIWACMAAMVKNGGTCSNEEVFWEKFAAIYEEKALADKPLFEEFYEKEFEGAKAYCKFNPRVPKAIRRIQEMGYRVVLATNPIFPAVATEARIRWAGLEPSDFELYTTYENYSYCKPNPAYYKEILDRLTLAGTEQLMPGKLLLLLERYQGNSIQLPAHIGVADTVYGSLEMYRKEVVDVLNIWMDNHSVEEMDKTIQEAISSISDETERLQFTQTWEEIKKQR